MKSKKRREFDAAAEERVARATAGDRRLLATSSRRVPTTGRTVQYRLTEGDVKRIRNSRNAANGGSGNDPHPGDIVPLIVVRVWPDEFSPQRPICVDYTGRPDKDAWIVPDSTFGINGQAILDGNDSIWVTSAPQAKANGCWSWPNLV